MTLTSNIMATRDFVYLVMGLTVLNGVFRPPHCEDIDFVLMIVTLIISYVYIAWTVMTVYGVMLP